MGLAFEFVTGDIRRIIESLHAVDPDGLEEAVAARADLSLHLLPKDLNLLSRAVGMHTGQPVRDLRPHLAAVADYPDRGAFVVASEWVEYVAATPADRIGTVVNTWFELMRTEHDEPDLQVTADAVDAVTELVTLCRYAQEKDQQVVHLWFA